MSGRSPDLLASRARFSLPSITHETGRLPRTQQAVLPRSARSHLDLGVLGFARISADLRSLRARARSTALDLAGDGGRAGCLARLEGTHPRVGAAAVHHALRSASAEPAVSRGLL